MMFMQFKIGPDMAICLIKSILFALLAVFIVMPGLLVLFAPLMEKTQHRSFIPKISFVGKFNYASRFIIPPNSAEALSQKPIPVLWKCFLFVFIFGLSFDTIVENYY